ncbi:hypothetical protein HCN44_009696 [Aphidius gifuensis]|uniref:Major facilitator superfamily associated domain-containing protein n=1 Tax=Aphidius gifuensis TaxID=684658 RepID=A0A835CYA0_APHGI|nr:folate-like transporter DDB_G0272544 [Aphidius gifuensis]KAF7998298.1 hypothetical protein HCN44_009696 [Aphidius gifuensis]
MMLIKNFFRRIYKDFRHKELLPLKMLFFVQASTLYVLYPYLTIHMRELGINVEETAIMSAVTPFVAIIMPPLAGLIADRIGNFKILLSFFSSLGGAAALLLLLVPVGRVTVKYPPHIIMDLECSDNDGSMFYSINQESQNCEYNNQQEILTNIQSCGYVCHIDFDNSMDLKALLTSKIYTVEKFDTKNNINNSIKYSRSNEDFLQSIANEAEYIKESRLLRNNEFYNTSIRQMSKNFFYFPTPKLFDFSCSNNQREINGTKNYIDDKIQCGFTSAFDGSRKNDFKPIKIKIKNQDVTEADEDEKKKRFIIEEIFKPGNNYSKAKCDNSFGKNEKIMINIPLVNWTINSEVYKIIQTQECSERCIVTANRKNMCSNMQTIIEYDVSLTFWLYLGFRVFTGIISGTAFAMFEGAVIAILREQKADYGLQRIYGSIGGMISSPLSGMLIDYASRGKEYSDFRPAFYLYAALKIASGGLMLAINLEFKSPAKNVVGDVISVLKNIEIVALLLACFVLGTAWGYIESFLFWLIQDLGGSRSLMGITITVGGIAGIPLLVLSGPIINKIGHANVLVIGFVFYAVRLVGYSLIYNPWLCLVFEALESVTTSLSFTAAVTYAAKLSTTTTDTSIQGLLGGLYYGVGKGCGSLIGGFLIKAVGTRPTYQIFAAVTFFMGIVYFFFNILYLRKHQVEGNDIVKKKPKKTQELNGIDNVALDINEKIDKKAIKANESDKINNIDSINDKKNDNNCNNESNELKIIKTINNDNNKNNANEENNKIDNSTVKVTTDIENQHDR